jgi:hypothetical protein
MATDQIIQNRRIQDPSMTDSEFLAQKAKRPQDIHVGKVWVQENAVTRIGGLALIRRRLDHHERAAEWFKSQYERLYGGSMSPAIDLSRVRVDTSIMAHDNGAVAGIDAARQLLDLFGSVAKPGLMQKDALDRIIACVVLVIPCSDSASPGPSGKPSGRAVEREVDRLLDALEELSEVVGFKTRGKAA